LTEQGWDIPRPQGNFVWFPTGEFTTEASDIFVDHGIVGRALGEGIRISIGEPEAVEKLLQAAAEVVGKLPSGA
jgi:histidinol-phosphate aminotransferase